MYSFTSVEITKYIRVTFLTSVPYATRRKLVIEVPSLIRFNLENGLNTFRLCVQAQISECKSSVKLSRLLRLKNNRKRKKRPALICIARTQKLYHANFYHFINVTIIAGEEGPLLIAKMHRKMCKLF